MARAERCLPMRPRAALSACLHEPSISAWVFWLHASTCSHGPMIVLFDRTQNSQRTPRLCQAYCGASSSCCYVVDFSGEMVPFSKLNFQEACNQVRGVFIVLCGIMFPVLIMNILISVLSARNSVKRDRETKASQSCFYLFICVIFNHQGVPTVWGVQSSDVDWHSDSPLTA